MSFCFRTALGHDDMMIVQHTNSANLSIKSAIGDLLLQVTGTTQNVVRLVHKICASTRLCWSQVRSVDQASLYC